MATRMKRTRQLRRKGEQNNLKKDVQIWIQYIGGKQYMLRPPRFDQVSDSQSFYLERSETSENSDAQPHSPQTLMNIVYTMKSLLEEAYDLIEGVQIAAGLRVLDKLSLLGLQLKSSTQNCDIQQSKNMIETQQIQLLCLYYKSYAFNYLQKQEELLKNNKITIQKFKHIIRKKQELLKNPRYVNGKDNSSDKISQKMKQMKNYLIQQKIKYQLLFVHFLLFACFRQSKSQNHKNAFQYAKQAHKILIDILIFFKNEHPRLSTRFFTNDKVQFSKIIIERALPIIKQILKQENFQNIQQSDNLQALKISLLSWEKNSYYQLIDFSANKYFEVSNKKFQQRAARNILGVKVIQNIQQKDDQQKLTKIKNIKDAMMIKLISIKQFQRNDNLIYHLSPFQVKYKIQLLCASYFCMGVQLQIISTSRQNLNKIFANQDRINKSSVSDAQQIKLSQMFQLKGVLLGIQYLSENKYFIESLTQNYKLNFERQMPTIIEQSSKFQQSSSIASKIISTPPPPPQKYETRKMDNEISVKQIYYVKKQPILTNNFRKNKSQKRISMKQKSNKKSHQISKSKNEEISKNKPKVRSSNKFKSFFNNTKQTPIANAKKLRKKQSQKSHSEKKIIINKTTKINNSAENVEQN